MAGAVVSGWGVVAPGAVAVCSLDEPGEQAQVVGHLLGVPLHRHPERNGWEFDGLDHPVAGAGGHAAGSYAEPIPAKRIRRLVSIFEDTDLEDALATMRRSGAHLARSFTAVGATVGVLFLEDIIEELVGEVQDATRRL